MDIFQKMGQAIVNLTMNLGGSELLGIWITRVLGAVLVLVYLLLNAIIIIYLERKISGAIQERKGPNRVGPAGSLQLFLDIVKLLGKNSFTPTYVDKVLYNLVPILVMIPIMLNFAILPFDDGLVAYDTDAGLLYYFAISGLTTIVLFMSGWAANNKYTLLGGMRATVCMISYEIPLLFAVMGIVMMTGTLNLSEIVQNQVDHGWFIWRQPLAFFIFLIAGTAEVNRSPFDLPEGEQELVAGYQTEYGGMKFAFMYLGEYLALFAMCVLTATLFLGGWHGPILPGWLWIFIKAYVLVFLNMWIRWTFPRIRIDHMMNLNWKFLIPLAIVNMTVTGIVIKALQLI